MLKKNTKSILNPSLPSPQPQKPRRLVTTILPSSIPATTKAPSITKQLLAKFENKYVNKVKEVKSTDSDISDLESIKGLETVGTKVEITALASVDVEEEVNYESDFEASDSDVPDNEKPPIDGQSRLEDKNSFIPKNNDEIVVHENIFTFEELMKNSANQLEAMANEIIVNEHDEISELLEDEIEEITDDDTSPKQGIPLLSQPVIRQSKNSENIFTSEDVPRNENVVTFSELFSKKDNVVSPSGNQVQRITQNNDKSGRKDSGFSNETVKEVKAVSSSHDNLVDKPSILMKSTKEVSSAKDSSAKEEEILISTRHAESTSQEKDQQRPKPKSKRKNSHRQSLEEKRRLERMFFLMEKQSLKGVVEQPVFSPLVMSWEKEAETAETTFDSQLASPEDAFAEMLRLRLRVTRDKMSAEYAAYRSCCAAAQILSSSHQPVTLAATRQIISQLKQPDPDRSESA